MNLTSWKQKIGLVAFGVFIALVALEILLRLGGFIFILKQEFRNRQLAQKDQVYTILCLGESTTALGGEQSYPRQLERLLNEGTASAKVKVINKGIPATTTTKIVQNLPIYFREYKPDMVVVMMGVNDGLDYISSKEEFNNNWQNFFYELRTVKLVRLLVAHLSKKNVADPQGADPQGADPNFWKEMERKIEPTVPNLMLLASLYRAAAMPDQEFKTLQKALVLDSNNYMIWAYMGEYYKRLGDYPNAIASFKKEHKS